MADALITKRALAAALKSLMLETPFEKICVSDICSACGMSRKSFYYHFRDKYDLVSWIFNSEFLERVDGQDNVTGWSLIDRLCAYFYENRAFYRRALAIEGQNSLSDQLYVLFRRVLFNDIYHRFGRADLDEFYVVFYADACVATVKRWIFEEDCMPPQDFVRGLKRCVVGMSEVIIEHFADLPAE